MKTDTEIREVGFQALAAKLGAVEAERFVTLILREPFDYTEWHKRLWEGEGVKSLSSAATAARKAEAEQNGAANSGSADAPPE